MNLRRLLNEITTIENVKSELKFLNESDTECWNRLRKLNKCSNKISSKDKSGLEIFRGFSNKSHLDNFLSGNLKPSNNGGMFGTGIFFTEDYSEARSYAPNDECVLAVKLIDKISDSKTCQNQLIKILETLEKSEGLLLWNKFKDIGLSSLLLKYPGIRLGDENIIIHDLKILSF